MIGTAEERLQDLDRLYPVWEEDTLWTRFQKIAERFAASDLLIFEDRSYTYGQTLEEIEVMLDRLYAIGIRPGDHVCLFMKNCPEYIFLIFALSKLGAVEVAGNIKISGHELHHVLELSDACCLISNVPLPATEEPLHEMKHVVVPEGECGRFPTGKATCWETFLSGKGETPDEAVRKAAEESQDPQSMSALFFTSGSTSLPKGVMIRHDMVLRSAYGTCRCRRMEIGRRAFLPLPLFHMRGFVEGVLALMTVGGTIVMSRKPFSPEHALEMLRRFQVDDFICLSPMMVNILTRCDVKPQDFPKLHAGSWSATCPEWVWDAARKAFGMEDVTTSYGMTETGSSFTMVSPSDPADVVKRCHGRLKPAGSAAAPGAGTLNEMKICDGNGVEVPAGTIGELYFRGLTITKGYYKNPEATSAAFTEDGWFRSGDQGMVDENGYFTFLGRKDDMYKINGENVSPMYLDGVISRCPLVNAVETMGIPHPKYGAVGVAFIDAKDTSEEAKEQIQAYMKKNLGRFQIPKYCFYSDSASWPRTGTGKITKKGLRELAKEKLAAMKELDE